MKLLASLVLLFLAGCSLIQPVPKPSPGPEPVAAQAPKEEPPARPPAEPPAAVRAEPVPAPPPIPEKPKPAPTPALRVAHVEWSSVNLREGPGTNYKIVGNVKKGSPLAVLEERGQWLRVRLDEGREAWVYKAATQPAPKPVPSSARPKPRPM